MNIITRCATRVKRKTRFFVLRAIARRWVWRPSSPRTANHPSASRAHRKGIAGQCVWRGGGIFFMRGGFFYAGCDARGPRRGRLSLPFRVPIGIPPCIQTPHGDLPPRFPSCPIRIPFMREGPHLDPSCPHPPPFPSPPAPWPAFPASRACRVKRKTRFSLSEQRI